MAAIRHLPQPHLNARRFGARCIPMLTDDALFEQTGVRVAFTGRAGGQSAAPYDSLNMGGHVGDDLQVVKANRQSVLDALGAPDAQLIVPNQVHGDVLVNVADADCFKVREAREQADKGADGLVVTVANVAALLCFADCVPVAIASPTGRFSVVHAGWRGVENGIAAKAVRALVQADASDLVDTAAGTYNVYVGPHIHAECFETAPDVRARFEERFGSSCIPDASHVDLLAALSAGLKEAGIDPARIVDSGICTKCSSDAYYSYRASGGTCGRHGAIAFRSEARTGSPAGAGR